MFHAPGLLKHFTLSHRRKKFLSKCFIRLLWSARLAGTLQHGLADGGDLVRQRLYSEGIAVGLGERVRPVPLGADDGDEAVGGDAADGGIGLEVLELHPTA